MFKINSINVIASTSYNLDKNTDCTICRQHLNNNSIYHQEKGLSSELKTGLCGHSYHLECISTWLTKSQKCPICSQPF